MVNQASDEDNAESIVGVPHDGHHYHDEDEDGDGQAKAEHEGPDFLARWHFWKFLILYFSFHPRASCLLEY